MGTRCENGSGRVGASLAAMLCGLLGTATPAIAQQPAPASVPGTAIVTRGPLEVDTIPILCVDRERPDRGFVTEADDPEWSPEVDLRLQPTTPKADSFRIRFGDGKSTYDRTISRGTYTEGPLLASVNLVSWDSGRGVDMYFVAKCTERLERRKKGR